MCYSLRRLRFDDNNVDQMRDCRVPLSTVGDTREECEDEVSSYYLFCRGNSHTLVNRCGHADDVLIQNGHSAGHSRYSGAFLHKHRPTKHTNLDKVKAEKAALKKAKKISKNIDRELEEQRLDYDNRCRLLLLGE